ncbi:MAG: PolC-type DNA polymerase III [Defluviitaleaceae bacterium]|nr:PolC-type DNA polymerase III [Defluviitaleaceae bacterium]
MQNKFFEVFADVADEAQIPQIPCKDAVVTRIVVEKATKTMDVDLLFSNIVDEHLSVWEQALCKGIPYIERVNINLSYSLQTGDTNAILQMYWENLANHYRSKSPLLYQALKEGHWHFENGVITIYAANAGMFNGDDVALFLRRRLGIDIAVKFTDETEQKRKQEEYAEYIANEETQIVQKIRERQKVAAEKAQKTNNNNQSGYKKNVGKRYGGIKIVDTIKAPITPLNTKLEEMDMALQGQIFFVDIKDRGDIVVFTFSVYDGNGSIDVKFFTNSEDIKNYADIIAVKKHVIVKGRAKQDSFTKELVLMGKEICSTTVKGREDNAPKKRVELHLHTNMSQMDAVIPAKAYIERAKAWGHTAIAITDHGVVQAYPEASQAKGIKIIYGMEAYIVDDQSAIVQSPKGQTLHDEYVVFDIETTGLSKEINKVIEVGAVKIRNGEIIDSFSSLIDPQEPLSAKIIELTNITDDMLAGQPKEKDVLPQFLEFCGDAVLVAHNAGFDVGFIRTSANRILNKRLTNTVLDTVELSRLLVPNIKNHKLNTVAEYFGIPLKNHHRALDDAKATAGIFLECAKILQGMEITHMEGINSYASQFFDTTKIKNHHHTTILVANQQGLRNLYELVSLSHVKYFYRNNRRPKTSRPRIPKGELHRFREGLILGTACIRGELYNGILENKPEDEIHKIADKYDFFEVQPHTNYDHIEGHDMREINKKIVDLGEEMGKPVVATGDVHFLDPADDIYRKIILFGEGLGDFSPPFYFRTTEEMLEQFSYLPPKKAEEIVIDNTNKIADMIEDVIPIPKGTFPPAIAGSEDELHRLTMENTHATYGDNLPEVVAQRLDKELNAIINNGFAVMYMASHTLIKRSLENKYAVGSRGSVGSSFVATMSNVTEVNPLPAHYLCKNCCYSDFDSADVQEFIANNPGGSGCDLPNKNCPNCNQILEKEGHDIPFETFLGFEGDKEPDIDLNFSGEYQQQAHDHAQELFGSDKVFKAGTISTFADKTAYGYTMKYLEEKGLSLSKAEINRIKLGATGVKRTTGQHPGGLMIVPQTHSIYDFTPVQRPANDVRATVTTTHFDYRSLSGRLQKLDLLGHDVPTVIRMLWDFTEIDPHTVPLTEKSVLSLFSGPEALGLTKADIDTGSLGIPEFGTGFVRGMLIDTKPKTFGELVRISGLSHGTDVWLNNAQALIKNGTCVLKDVISTRDDIMVYLISKGIDKKMAFNITEDVRKGKGLKPEWEEEMRKNDVPTWYIESCKKIKYLFPKGHAVAYVMMAVRIAYYKVFHPYSFYGAVLSMKTGDFDYELMCVGHERVIEELKRIKEIPDPTATEKNLQTTLELVNEMYLRKLKFVPLDIYKANVSKFIVTEDGLMAPLASLKGLGETVAQNIVNQRLEGEFTSLEDFKERTKATKTTLELLVTQGILKGLPEGRQLTLW